MDTASKTTAHPEPTTVEALLDHEEGLAIQRIADSVQRLGNDLCAAADLRRRIRSHPFAATGFSAFMGFVGGPLVLKAFKRVLTMASRIPNPAPRRSITLPGLVLASIRAVRARP